MTEKDIPEKAAVLIEDSLKDYVKRLEAIPNIENLSSQDFIDLDVDYRIRIDGSVENVEKGMFDNITKHDNSPEVFRTSMQTLEMLISTVTVSINDPLEAARKMHNKYYVAKLEAVKVRISTAFELSKRVIKSESNSNKSTSDLSVPLICLIHAINNEPITKETVPALSKKYNRSSNSLCNEYTNWRNRPDRTGLTDEHSKTKAKNKLELFEKAKPFIKECKLSQWQDEYNLLNNNAKELLK